MTNTLEMTEKELVRILKDLPWGLVCKAYRTANGKGRRSGDERRLSFRIGAEALVVGASLDVSVRSFEERAALVRSCDHFAKKSGRGFSYKTSGTGILITRLK